MSIHFKEINELSDDSVALIKSLIEFESSLIPDMYKLLGSLDESIKAFYNPIIKNRSNICLIAIDENKTIGIGIAGIIKQAPHHRERFVGSVEMIYVDEKHRRIGIGSAILGGIESFFRNNNVSVMNLYCIYNNPSLEFYNSLGFKVHSIKMVKEI